MLFLVRFERYFFQIGYNAANVVCGTNLKSEAFAVFAAIEQKIVFPGVLYHQFSKGAFQLRLIGNYALFVDSLGRGENGCHLSKPEEKTQYIYFFVLKWYTFINTEKEMTNLELRRNNTLDVIKLFASYMVVFVHAVFYGKLGVLAAALARFAVPLFFLVSGFYAYKAPAKVLKRRMLRLLRLYLFAALAYTVYNVLIRLLHGNPQDVAAYLRAYANPNALLKLILLNLTICSAHLWYLLAGVYVYGIFYFAAKYNVSEKLIFIVSLLALLLHLFLGEVLSVFERYFPLYYVRNFALFGVPFFGFGLLVNKHQEKLRTIPGFVILLSGVAGVFATVLSRYLLCEQELYAGSLLMVFSLVLVFLKFPNVSYPRWLLTLTGCSTYIYICHPLLSSIMKELYAAFSIPYADSAALQIIHPLFICVLSTAVAYGLNKVTKRK